RLFPSLRDTPIAHAWTGVFGVSRDWAAAVHCDRQSGMCWARGYASEGGAAPPPTPAARTLPALVLGRDPELTRLPWVAHRAPDWEPEPLRWLAVQAVYGGLRAAAAVADRDRPPARPRPPTRGPPRPPVAPGPRGRRALGALADERLDGLAEDLGVTIDVGGGRRWRHERHVGEGGDHHAAVEQEEVQRVLQRGVEQRRARAARTRRVGSEGELGPGAEGADGPRGA